VLILLRHGRTAANASGRLQGLLDQPLDDVGIEQAAAAASKLPRPARLISSPLLRARQTADAFGMPYEVDPRWEELHYGIYEGRLMSEVAAATWDQWRGDPQFVPEGGESLAQLGARVWEACDDLLDDARERDVVVVAHVSPIKAAVAWALRTDLGISWRCHLDQAAICRIAVLGRGPVLVGFNETP
jgi:broad specificity phosphatase PhoE